MKNTPKSRNKDLVVQESNDELLVYDLKSNKAVCLNQTASVVWKMCDGKRTIFEISKDAGMELGKPITNDLIWLTIQQLSDENLLSNSEAIENKFKGMSRREVIRKVGMASMVALPIVSSIVAPEAMSAASGMCGVPTNQCLPANTFNVCPPECTGNTINASFFDTDVTCNPASLAGSNSFLCNGNPRFFNEPFIITSIT